MTEVLKAPKPSPAKTDSCNPFHNRTQDRTKERENWTVLDLGISKDREWAAKAPRVGLLNTYCAGKRPRTGWSTRLSILKKTLRDATLRLCQRSQLTLPPLNRPTWLTTRSSNDRWEVAADIQTGEQYSSTGSINAQKHLATTVTSRKTLIVFLKMPTLIEAEAAIEFGMQNTMNLICKIQWIWYAKYNEFGMQNIMNLVCKIQLIWYAKYYEFSIQNTMNLVCEIHWIWYAILNANWYAKSSKFGTQNTMNLVCKCNDFGMQNLYNPFSNFLRL